MDIYLADSYEFGCILTGEISHLSFTTLDPVAPFTGEFIVRCEHLNFDLPCTVTKSIHHSLSWDIYFSHLGESDET